MSKKAETFLRECCEDHLRINVGKDKDELMNMDTYDLFVQVYESVSEFIEEKKQARKDDNFDRFRAADERLWMNGFAIIAFAVAEKLGWMKDQKPVRVKDSGGETCSDS